MLKNKNKKKICVKTVSNMLLIFKPLRQVCVLLHLCILYIPQLPFQLEGLRNTSSEFLLLNWTYWAGLVHEGHVQSSYFLWQCSVIYIVYTTIYSCMLQRLHCTLRRPLSLQLCQRKALDQALNTVFYRRNNLLIVLFLKVVSHHDHFDFGYNAELLVWCRGYNDGLGLRRLWFKSLLDNKV